MSLIRNTGFYIYLYSSVPVAWAPSVSGGSWPAEISTLASLFIYILWCLKNELLMWVEEANYTNIYSGFCQMFIYILWCLKNELLLWVEEANYTNIYSGFCQCSRYGSRSFREQSKKMKKNLDLYCFVTSLWLFIFEEWCKCTFKKE